MAGLLRPSRRVLPALLRFRGQRLGLGYPGIGSARQADFFTDQVRLVVIEFGELPEVEDTEIFQFLLDRARHAGELLEIVGGAAWTGEALEARGLRGRRDFLANGLSRGSDVGARVALRP